MAVGAHDLALLHLLDDLMPLSSICAECCHARDFGSAKVVPVQAPAPLAPATVATAAHEFDRVIVVLMLEPTPPREWHSGVRLPGARVLLLGDVPMTPGTAEMHLSSSARIRFSDAHSWINRET